MAADGERDFRPGTLRKTRAAVGTKRTGTATEKNTGARKINPSPFFLPVFEEFSDASYLQRYDLLCQRLVQEQLYTTAAVITANRTDQHSGNFRDLSAMTSLKTFVTALAGHVASTAARLG